MEIFDYWTLFQASVNKFLKNFLYSISNNAELGTQRLNFINIEQIVGLVIQMLLLMPEKFPLDFDSVVNGDILPLFRQSQFL